MFFRIISIVVVTLDVDVVADEDAGRGVHGVGQVVDGGPLPGAGDPVLVDSVWAQHGIYTVMMVHFFADQLECARACLILLRIVASGSGGWGPGARGIESYHLEVVVVHLSGRSSGGCNEGAVFQTIRQYARHIIVYQSHSICFHLFLEFFSSRDLLFSLDHSNIAVADQHIVADIVCGFLKYVLLHLSIDFITRIGFFLEHRRCIGKLASHFIILIDVQVFLSGREPTATFETTPPASLERRFCLLEFIRFTFSHC